MKIAHVVRQFYPSVGGLEDYVYNLAKEQIDDGDDVSIITLDTDFQTGQALQPSEQHHGLSITRLPWRGSQRYPLCWISPALLNQHDVVHVHAVDFFVDCLSMLKRFGVLNTKLVLSTHGGFFHTSKNRRLKELYFNSITRFTLSRLDAVVCSSTNDQALFKTIAPNAVLVNNAIRVRKFGGAVNPAPAPDLVYLGRFSSNKRVPWLIRAFAALEQPAGKLKIIGQSKTGDAAELRQLVASLHCEERVQLLLDISNDDIARHVTGSRFTVSASAYEGFGLSVVELMSYGLVPLLAQEPLTFNNFVDESRVGKIFSVADNTFAERYHTLMNEWAPAQAQSASEYAKNFSWKATASEMSNVYKSTFEDSLRAY